MDIDLRLTGKVSATLLGLSFAALSCGYTWAYSSEVPQTFKARMIGFLSGTSMCALSFLICCAFAFFAMKFLNSEKAESQRKGAALLSLLAFWIGLVNFGVALLTLYGYVLLKFPLIPS